MITRLNFNEKLINTKFYYPTVRQQVSLYIKRTLWRVFRVHLLVINLRQLTYQIFVSHHRLDYRQNQQVSLELRVFQPNSREKLIYQILLS